MPPLLSIIIPTKNRQYTAVFAVESVLNIPSDQIEVVIQDCSSDNSLEEMLVRKFPTDQRIKYFHSGSDTISLTENWNLAIENTSGKYISGIGDDDAVMPDCLEVVKWMDANGYDTVLGPFITYIWKDAYIGSFSNSRLTHATTYTGNILKVNLEEEFNKKALHCGFGYTEGLPNLYHGFVKRNLFEQHKLNSGCYLGATSFDVYNSIALPAYTNSFYYVDYPLSIRGASGKSNANRLVSKKFHKHFEEFKNLKIPDILPRILSGEISVAESTIVALQDIKRGDLIARMKLSVVFAKSAAYHLGEAYRFYKHYQQIKNEYNNNADFFRLFRKFLWERFKSVVLDIILKIIYKVVPQPGKLIEKLAHRRKVIQPDILAAVTSLADYMLANNISINYNQPFAFYPTKKETWD